MDTVIGYVIKNEYYRNKYYFDGTIENITRFIVQFGDVNGINVRIILTDQLDDFLLSTYGQFLDEIIPEVREMIIDELIALQMGKPYKKMEFVEVEPGVMKLM